MILYICTALFNLKVSKALAISVWMTPLISIQLWSRESSQSACTHRERYVLWQNMNYKDTLFIPNPLLDLWFLMEDINDVVALLLWQSSWHYWHCKLSWIHSKVTQDIDLSSEKSSFLGGSYYPLWWFCSALSTEFLAQKCNPSFKAIFQISHYCSSPFHSKAGTEVYFWLQSNSCKYKGIFNFTVLEAKFVYIPITYAKPMLAHKIFKTVCP